MHDTQTGSRTANRVEIVCFTVEDRDFSIEISHVLEIRGWTSTTTLPHAPDFVVGMMNLRGTVLPVVDLSLRLGFGKTEPGKRHVIIIAQIDHKIIGFWSMPCPTSSPWTKPRCRRPPMFPPPEPRRSSAESIHSMTSSSGQSMSARFCQERPR